MLFNNNLPNTFWGDALLAAVYLYSLIPHSLKDFKTPFEIRKGKKPTYNNIKTWGLKVFYNANREKTKL